MRLVIVVALVIVCGCESRVSRLPYGGLIVGGGPDGALRLAMAGDRCEGSTPSLSLTLQMRNATIDTASAADVGQDAAPCAGRMFRAHGLDQQGQGAAITFEFQALERACRSGRGRLTVTSADRTIVVEDASFAPAD
jgi:hypothetical protein